MFRVSMDRVSMDQSMDWSRDWSMDWSMDMSGFLDTAIVPSIKFTD